MTTQTMGRWLRFWLACLGFLGVTCVSALAGPYSAWSYRMPIQFTGYHRPETLTNFPVLVAFSNGNGFSYANFQSSSNYDLGFSTADGVTPLNYEIDQWNTNGVSLVWVQVPALVDSNTTIWAYYGHAGLTAAQAFTTNGATWTNAYVGVWHFNEGSGTIVHDSCRHLNGTFSTTGTSWTTNLTSLATNMGNAVQFNPAQNGYITLGTIPTGDALQLTTGYTISLWARIDGWGNNDGTGNPRLVDKADNSYDSHGYGFGMAPTATPPVLDMYVNGQNPTWNAPYSSTLLSAVRNYAVVQSASTAVVMYVNGTALTNVSGNQTSPPSNLPANYADTLYFGSAQWQQRCMNGMLDEVRISSKPQSSNWVWSCYMTIASNGAFQSYGTPQVMTIPVVDNGGGASNVTDHSSTCLGNLVTNAGVATTVCLLWDSTNQFVSKAWSYTNSLGVTLPGPLSTNLTGLASNTMYYYTYYAFNASTNAWPDTNVSFKTYGPPAVNNASGATALSYWSATINGNLANGVAAHIWIYYGTSTNAWSNVLDLGTLSEGAFTVPVSGLSSGTPYYYQCVASNAYGAVATSAPSLFTTLTAGAYYVTPNGAGLMNGADWADAFNNVQSALSIATSATDRIYLQSGTYPLAASLVLANATGVNIGGGYAGSGTPGSLDGGVTVLSRGSSTNRLFAAYASTATLERVTISGGLTSDSGAGLYLTNCVMTLTNCVVANNTVFGNQFNGSVIGGGLYIDGQSTVQLSGCQVTNNCALNTASYGNATAGGAVGGAAYVGTNVTLVLGSCTFSRNFSGGPSTSMNPQGGDIYFTGRQGFTVSDCTFRDNAEVAGTLPRSAGDIAIIAEYVPAIPVLFRNCQIVGNCGGGINATLNNPNYPSFAISNCLIAANGGGGLNFFYGAGVQVVNCTIADNVGWGVFDSGYTALTVSNCVVWGNTSGGISGNVLPITLNTCDQESQSGVGNFVANPFFVYGYRLAVAGLQGQFITSPCIDAGTNSAASLGLAGLSTRSDGAAESGKVDLGFHYPAVALSASAMSNSVLYVDANNGSDANNGWAPGAGNALRTMTCALSKVNDGGTVNLASGTYNSGSGEIFPLVLSAVNLTLSGAGTTTVCHGAAPNRVLTCTDKGHVSLANLTIEAGACSNGYGGGLFAQYIDLTITNCLVQKNTIFGGTANSALEGGGLCLDRGLLHLRGSTLYSNLIATSVNSFSYGGGLCAAGAATVVCSNTLLSANSIVSLYNGSGPVQNGGGGGFGFEVPSSGSATFDGCTFSNNFVASSYDYHYAVGGAIESDGASLIVRNCAISGNYVSGQANSTRAATIYAGWDGSHPMPLTLVNTLVDSNGAPTEAYGAILYAAGGVFTATNLLVSRSYGNGIRVNNGTLATLQNCTLASNQWWGLTNTSATTATLSNSIVWSNGFGGVVGLATANYCDLQDANYASRGSNNISADPLFVSPATGDFHEKSRGGSWHNAVAAFVNDAFTSPCIDVGDPADLRWQLEPQPNGRRLNLGVFGGTAQASKTPGQGTAVFFQ